jgi:hypothetical protein
MSILSDLTNYVLSHTATCAFLKPEFKRYIADQSIPLDTRWDFWLKAPVEMKRTSPWMVHFACLPEDFLSDGPFHMDKYQTLECSDMVEYIVEMYSLEMNENPDEYDVDAVHVVDVVRLKEEILSANLHAFTLDW